MKKLVTTKTAFNIKAAIFKHSMRKLEAFDVKTSSIISLFKHMFATISFIRMCYVPNKETKLHLLTSTNNFEFSFPEHNIQR